MQRVNALQFVALVTRKLIILEFCFRLLQNCFIYREIQEIVTAYDSFLSGKSFLWYVKNMKKIVGFEVFTAVVMKSDIVWDITSCSPLKVNRRFGGTYRLYLQGRDINQARNQRSRSVFHLLSRWFLSQLIFSTLKMEAMCSSETSVDTQRTTRRYIPEDCTLLRTKWLSPIKFLTSFIYCSNVTLSLPVTFSNSHARTMKQRKHKVRSLRLNLPFSSGPLSSLNRSMHWSDICLKPCNHFFTWGKINIDIC
jgi:hypothetical protein